MAIVDLPELGAPESVPLGLTGLSLRPLDPLTDGPRLRAMCHRVSLQSRYQRFFSGLRFLSDALLGRLLDVDHDRREALVALEGDEIVAVARYATASPSAGEAPSAADLSVLVVDDLQRRGLATALIDRLARLAAERGIEEFTASVLLENQQARGLVRRTWPHARGHYEGGYYTYRLPVVQALGSGW